MRKKISNTDFLIFANIGATLMIGFMMLDLHESTIFGKFMSVFMGTFAIINITLYLKHIKGEKNEKDGSNKM